MRKTILIVLGILCLSAALTLWISIFSWWAHNAHMTEMQVFLEFCWAWPIMLLLAAAGAALLASPEDREEAK